MKTHRGGNEYPGRASAGGDRMNGYWKWIATTAVGILLVLLGSTIQKVMSDREIANQMRALELGLHELTVTVAGPEGYGARLADHENRLRKVERGCP